MKYIKTNTGVYEVTDELTINMFGHLAKKSDPVSTIAGVGEIIKESDTIEELCEKNYCIVEWRSGIETICPYDLAQTLMVNCPDKINGAYLCVFTPTGLTKVARITEDGGAELL